MKRLLLLTEILLAGCASGSRWSWNGVSIERDNGKYGSSETSNGKKTFSEF